MAREPNIPLFLWVAAAIVTHLTWGGGADQVAEVFEERADVRRFAASVQHQVRQRFNVEVALYDENDLPAIEAPRDEPRAVDGQPDDEPSEPPKPEELEKEKQKPKDEAEPEPDPAQKLTSKEPAKPKPEDEKKKEAEKPKEEQPKPEEEQAPIEQPQPNVDTRRVAVVQHVEDDKQADNPEAEFLAEHNNRVREQQQARITATDQDNKDPTPGSQHMGPTEDPGDSHVTDIAQSDDSPGELNRAPSEDKLAAQQKESVSVSQPQGIPEVAGRVQGGPQKDDPGAKGQTAQSASRTEEAVPSVTNSADGSWQIAGEREARLARAAREARRHRSARPAGNPDRPLDFLGLGATGRTEMGVNLNLSPGTALAAIGQDQLAREIQADGERRRSQHQGSWKAVGIERWRPAIENYVASVKLGNQTALNTAAVPFATYLNHIHNRLHPIFAGSYLSFLDGLPGSAGLRDNDMATNLEIVLSQANGSIVKMGVTRTSGVTAFDISALDAVQRASPFGAPPPSIVSPDGNVYLHWEFHRNPLLACSTYFARPYIIKAPQKSAPPASEPPGGPFGPEEGGSPPAKQGHNSGPGAGRDKTARLTNYAAP